MNSDHHIADHGKSTTYASNTNLRSLQETSDARVRSTGRHPPSGPLVVNGAREPRTRRRRGKTISDSDSEDSGEYTLIEVAAPLTTFSLSIEAYLATTQYEIKRSRVLRFECVHPTAPEPRDFHPYTPVRRP